VTSGAQALAPVVAPVPSQGPVINMNLPPIRKFCEKDRDSHGIDNFIARIERNTEYECFTNEREKEAARITTFRSYLGGDAKDHLGILPNED
jgi:hypothetical protein